MSRFVFLFPFAYDAASGTKGAEYGNLIKGFGVIVIIPNNTSIDPAVITLFVIFVIKPFSFVKAYLDIAYTDIQKIGGCFDLGCHLVRLYPLVFIIMAVRKMHSMIIQGIPHYILNKILYILSA
mgnify:CR=1 FL=1